jgi:nucleoid-associated protein YgaU
MTRENKLAIVIGFGLLLFVGILVSDHLSARNSQIANPQTTAVHLEPTRLPGAPEVFGEPMPPAKPNNPVAGGGTIADGSGGAPFDDVPLPPIQTVPEAPKERTHAIAKGETLGDVAKRYYGKRALGAKLAEFNKADSSRLKIGQTIKIPDITVLDPAAAPAPAAVGGFTDPIEAPLTPGGAPQVQQPVMPEPPAPSKFGTVKVAEGDTLYRIAKRVYGDGSRWSEIATLNNLSDGKALKPGRELKYALAR